MEGRSALTDLIYKARVDRNDDGLRPHLGASQIGAPCPKALWYGFRWVKKSSFNGRMLRLFETGQLAESRFVEELRWIGCEVTEGPEQGKQWRVSELGGHFGGSMDGAVVGLPSDPETWHCVEFKTHGEKSFKDLISKGVQVSKPQHYAQMQVYMSLTGMTKALYMAVNKNTDDLHTEIIDADPELAKSLLKTAEKVIFSEEAPMGISSDPSYYLCKWCDFSDICHGTEAPLPTCRSCAHVTPERNGKWSCGYFKNDNLSVAEQKAGCIHHRFAPTHLANFAEVVDGSQELNVVTYRNKLNGELFSNSADGYRSDEIHFAGSKTVLGDPVNEEMRKEFNAKIVETPEFF